MDVLRFKYFLKDRGNQGHVQTCCIFSWKPIECCLLMCLKTPWQNWKNALTNVVISQGVYRHSSRRIGGQAPRPPLCVFSGAYLRDFLFCFIVRERLLYVVFQWFAYLEYSFGAFILSEMDASIGLVYENSGFCMTLNACLYSNFYSVKNSSFLAVLIGVIILLNLTILYVLLSWMFLPYSCFLHYESRPCYTHGGGRGPWPSLAFFF